MTSKADLKRYMALQEIGCVACLINGHPGTPGDVHHLVDKGTRKLSGGNKSTFVLCVWHHRGEPLFGHSVSYMQSVYGPSMALQSKHFAVVFGNQRDLLARTNAVIK